MALGRNHDRPKDDISKFFLNLANSLLKLRIYLLRRLSIGCRMVCNDKRLAIMALWQPDKTSQKVWQFF